MSLKKSTTTSGPHRALSGPLAIITAASLWGTNGVAQTFAPSGTGPMALGFVRLALIGLFLGLLCRREGSLPKAKQLFSLPVLLGAGGIALFQVGFFASAPRIGVALATVISIGGAPFFTGILARICFSEPFSKKWLQATFIGSTGLILICGSSGFGSLDTTGVILATLASLGYSVFLVCSHFMGKVLSSKATPAVFFSVAAILLLPVTVTENFSWILSARGALVAVYLGGISGAVGYVLFFRGLKKTPANQAPILGLAEPLTATLLGFVLLGERLSLAEMIGAALILVSLVSLVLPERHPCTPLCPEHRTSG
jgi:DME family drug/metabolite transporter